VFFVFYREKFHFCPLKPYISCTFSYLFWRLHMLFSALQLCFWEVHRYATFDMLCSSAAEFTFVSCFLQYLLIAQIHQWKQWENGIQKDAPGNGRIYPVAHISLQYYTCIWSSPFFLLCNCKSIQRTALFLGLLGPLGRYRTHGRYQNLVHVVFPVLVTKFWCLPS